MTNEECLFCKIINKEVSCDLIYEDNDVIAFRDINPQAPVHILVIPKRHISTLLEIKDEDKELIGKIFLVINEIAYKEGIAQDGFRVIANCNRLSGQAIFHMHFHILGGRRLSWPPG